MVSFEHKGLVDLLEKADATPGDPSEFSEWFRGRRHLALLRQDVQEGELILAALGPAYSCVNSYVVSVNHPALSDPAADLKGCSPNPLHNNAARYSWAWSSGSDNEKPRAEFRAGGMLPDLPRDVTPLVYFRTIDGLTSPEGPSVEIDQPFAHVSDIHWLEQRRSYSRLDHRGDWDDIVSVATARQRPGTDLVSCHRTALDLHLIAMDAVLVRAFEFLMHRPAKALEIEYSVHVDRDVTDDRGLQYVEQINEGNFGAIRGVQIIAPRLSASEMAQLVKKGRIIDADDSRPVAFKILDWRNGKIATVSTDPATTTNYFESGSNELPYDTSPAMFRLKSYPSIRRILRSTVFERAGSSVEAAGG